MLSHLQVASLQEAWKQCCTMNMNLLQFETRAEYDCLRPAFKSNYLLLFYPTIQMYEISLYKLNLSVPIWQRTALLPARLCYIHSTLLDWSTTAALRCLPGVHLVFHFNSSSTLTPLLIPPVLYLLNRAVIFQIVATFFVQTLNRSL
jgi:hypothetical protein